MTVDAPVLAAFDFDETLTRRDTVVPFLRRLAGNRRLGSGIALRSVRTFQALARRDRHLLRSIVTEVVFTGRPIDAVELAAAEFGDQLAADGVIEPVYQNDQVVIYQVQR